MVGFAMGTWYSHWQLGTADTAASHAGPRPCHPLLRKDANSYNPGYEARTEEAHLHRLHDEKKKKCTPDHFDEDEVGSLNATDSDAMVVDTPDTGGDLEWQERGKIDGFGDGIRDFSTGSRKSKVQPVWSYRRCVYSLSPEIKEGRAQTLYQKKGKGIFKRVLVHSTER
jgi:hypothetical protein